MFFRIHSARAFCVRRDDGLLVLLEKAPIGDLERRRHRVGSSALLTNRFAAVAICKTSAASAVENSSCTENSTGRLVHARDGNLREVFD